MVSNGTSPIILPQISPEWITALVAVAALGMTIFIAYRQISIQKEQTEIARNQTEIARQQLDILNYQEQERRREMGKAELTAEFMERSQRTIPFEYLLRILNKGKTKARDIRILIDDKPAHEYFAFLGTLKDEDIPRTLERGVPWVHNMAFAIDRERKFKIRLDWSDNSGEPGSFEQLLVPVKEA
jgi:hypothetical protein